MFLNSFVNPMIPQATLAPACPVVFESGNPPLPKSSVSSCTTQLLPTTLSSPNSLICVSFKARKVFPLSSV